MKNLEKNLACLNFMSTCKPPIRKLILKNAKKDLIYAICECILNTINGNVELDPQTKIKITKHKKALRKLIDRRDSVKNKKKILLQKGGGFLPLLLPTILEVASNIFGIKK